jgi:hypothetical protein
VAVMVRTARRRSYGGARGREGAAVVTRAAVAVTAVHGRTWSSGSHGGAVEQRARARIDSGGGGWKKDM